MKSSKKAPLVPLVPCKPPESKEPHLESDIERLRKYKKLIKYINQPQTSLTSKDKPRLKEIVMASTPLTMNVFEYVLSDYIGYDYKPCVHCNMPRPDKTRYSLVTGGGTVAFECKDNPKCKSDPDIVETVNQYVKTKQDFHNLFNVSFDSCAIPIRCYLFRNTRYIPSMNLYFRVDLSCNKSRLECFPGRNLFYVW